MKAPGNAGKRCPAAGHAARSCKAQAQANAIVPLACDGILLHMPAGGHGHTYSRTRRQSESCSQGAGSGRDQSRPSHVAVAFATFEACTRHLYHSLTCELLPKHSKSASEPHRTRGGSSHSSCTVEERSARSCQSSSFSSLPVPTVVNPWHQIPSRQRRRLGPRAPRLEGEDPNSVTG